MAYREEAGRQEAGHLRGELSREQLSAWPSRLPSGHWGQQHRLPAGGPGRASSEEGRPGECLAQVSPRRASGTGPEVKRNTASKKMSPRGYSSPSLRDFGVRLAAKGPESAVSSSTPATHPKGKAACQYTCPSIQTPSQKDDLGVNKPTDIPSKPPTLLNPVLDSWTCLQVPRSGGFSDIYFLTILEARSMRSRCRQNCFLRGPLSMTCRRPPSCCPHTVFPACVSTSSFPLLFMASPAACGGSQAWDQIRAAVMAYPTAMPDPSHTGNLRLV